MLMVIFHAGWGDGESMVADLTDEVLMKCVCVCVCVCVCGWRTSGECLVITIIDDVLN